MLMSARQPLRELENATEFVARHVGITEDERHMLSAIGAASRRRADQTIVPAAIKRAAPMALPAADRSAGARRAEARSPRATSCSRASSARGCHGTHAGRHPAQHPREPSTVHRLHAYQAEIRRAALEAW